MPRRSGRPERAVEYNVLRRRGPTATRSPSSEAAARLRTALALGVGGPAARAAMQLELGGACHRAGQALEARRRLPGRGDSSRASSATPRCWRARRSATRRRAGARVLDHGARSSCSRKRQTRSATTTPSCAWACSAGWRARSTAGPAGAARLVARTAAIAMARRLGDRTGLATVPDAVVWSRGGRRSGEVLAMLTEASELGGRLGGHEILAEAMAWQVPALLATCDLEARAARVAALREIAERHARSRSCCTSPSTTRGARALRRAPRGGRGARPTARTSGAAC